MPAALAAVGAEVTDVGGVVGVRRSAAHAVLRVGRVLERRSRVSAGRRRRSEARRLSRCGEIGDERVVGVDDERHARVELADRRRASAPRPTRALRSGRADRGRGCRARPRAAASRRISSGSAALVDLEQREVGVARREEGGSDPRCEVRTRVVPGQPVAGVRGSSPPLRSWSSSRSSPRRAPRRSPAAPASSSIAPGRPSTAACRGASSHRRARRRATGSDGARGRRLESEDARACRRAYRGAGGRIRRGRPLWRLAILFRKLYSDCMARSRRRHPALAGIDEAALAEFRAGLRRRYTDDQILDELQRERRPPGPLADDARVRGRPGRVGSSADRDRALRHLERGQAGGRA